MADRQERTERKPGALSVVLTLLVYGLLLTTWVLLASPVLFDDDTAAWLSGFLFALFVLIHITTGFVAGHWWSAALCVVPGLLAIALTVPDYDEDVGKAQLAVLLLLFGGPLVLAPLILAGFGIREWLDERRTNGRRA